MKVLVEILPRLLIKEIVKYRKNQQPVVMKKEIGKLSDPRLRKLGTRLLLLEEPTLLTVDQRLAGYEYFKGRWTNARNDKRGWTTFGSVQKQLEELVKLGLFSEQKKNSFDVFYSTREEELKKAFGL